MDAIQEVVHSLDDVQQKEFVSFVQRNKYKKGRKDLQLFNLLKQEQEHKPVKMVQLLGTSNMNAYHTIRKRLFSHLADFIVLKSTSDDASTLSHVNGLMGVVSYLFDKGLDKFAWKYLLIAEKLAEQHNYHDQLNSIYLLQIEKVHLNREINLDELIKKYQENQVVLKLNEKLQIASSLIRTKLNLLKEQGINPDFQDLVYSILGKLQININVLQVPKIVLDFVKIIRASIIAKKDFYNFEPFVEKNYQRLLRSGNFVSPVVKAEFLYMLAHTVYRNKKFDQSLRYVEELELLLKECPKSYKRSVNTKVKQMHCANLVFLNRLEESISILERYKDSDVSNSDNINTVLNLGIYHFLNNNFKQSHSLLAEFTHSDNWYIKQMGVEWLLKKYLMEILLFIELGYDDLVDSRIKSVERKFKPLKSNPVYDKAFAYLNVIKKYVSSTDLSAEELNKAMQKNFDFLPYEEEDIQAMAFYAWLKSKVNQRGFYETLLGLIK